MRLAIFFTSIALLTSCGGAAPPVEEPVPTPVAEPAATPSGPPVAEVRPVTNTYHGVDVVDPYQWLEDPSDPEVRAWSDAQNAWARQYLDALPGRETIGARVRAILTSAVRSHRDVTPAGGRFFALEHRPPREQPFIVVLSSLDDPDSARVLVDPTAIDESGAVAIDWLVPSPDGTTLAVSLSRGGSERGDVHV